MNRNIRLLGVGAGVRALGVAMLTPFISIYLREVLGLSYIAIGFLLIVIGVVPLVVSPFGGLVTDRIGRRRLFLAMLAVEALGIGLVAVSMGAESVAGIVVSAAVANLAGGALAGPALAAYTADLTALPERSRAFSWQRIGFNGGYVAGVIAGGYLTLALGYSSAGFLASAIMLAAAALLAAVLSPSPYDLARAKGGSPEGAPSPQGPSSIRESMRILGSDRVFLTLCLAFFLANLAEAQWANTLPLYIGPVLRLPNDVVGVALSLNGLIVVVGQNQVTKWATGHLHTSSANFSILLYVAAYLSLGALGLGWSGWGLVAAVMAAIVVLTVGENFAAIPQMTMPSNLAPPTEIGSYNGAFGLFTGAGYVFAPALGGAALSATSNTLLAWGLMMIPAIPAFVLFAKLGKRIPTETNTV
ncbi:MAG: MFS transporter [Nitrososphaerota archaeon]|nr:MFS transporter [Nitrososphaerota archaeon]